MNREQTQELDHGIYRINWDEEAGGGFSIAAVGSMYNGDRWLAPLNWTAQPGRSPATCSYETWAAVESAQKILDSRGEPDPD